MITPKHGAVAQKEESARAPGGASARGDAGSSPAGSALHATRNAAPADILEITSEARETEDEFRFTGDRDLFITHKEFDGGEERACSAFLLERQDVEHLRHWLNRHAESRPSSAVAATAPFYCEIEEHEPTGVRCGEQCNVCKRRKPSSTVEAPEVDLMKALKEKLPQGVPVAWRYRYGPKGTWKYADSAADVNPSPQYEQQPLYTAPSPASSIEACSDEPPVIFSAGTWTWSGDGRAYDSRELDAAAWHKLKKPVSAKQASDEIGVGCFRDHHYFDTNATTCACGKVSGPSA